MTAPFDTHAILGEPASSTPLRIRRGHEWIMAALLVPLFCSGCVERWIYVRTEPVGAQVFVDGRDVGPSPARVPFEHYGSREILVRAPSYASKSEIVHVHAPWYQWFPIDLLSEHLWPWTLTDQHEITVTLEGADTEALLESLEDFSAKNSGAGVDDSVDENTPNGDSRAESTRPSNAEDANNDKPSIQKQQ